MRMSLAALGALLCASLAVAPAASAAPGTFSSSALRKHVNVDGILEHEKALQLIADANGGIRPSGSPGYDASADYVARKLRAAGLKVTRQPFEFRFFEQLSRPEMARVAPGAHVYVAETDFATMDYSGSAPGGVTAAVQAVDLTLPPGAPNTSTSGCEAADFAGFVAGNIALMQRGTCGFGVKARNAQAAGAKGAIIFNEGQAPDRTELIRGTLGADNFTEIPVVGTTFAVGQELASSAGAVVRLRTETFQEVRQTENVFGDTRKGDPNRMIVIGAHLDSVPGGPGINDNGSGTAQNLEIAEELRHAGRVRNHLRFAFWGAEEAGLVGSTLFVENLSEEELARIKANLNYDMVASPNYVRFVYDGDGSAGLSAPGPDGSGLIERLFLDYFADQGLATEPTAFDGRSDYGPFIAAGIPAGGTFTGAEGIKTPEQAAIFGGTAGQPYDPCYHEACDTIDNVNPTVLDQMADAAAHVLVQLARTRGDIVDSADVRRDASARRQAEGPHDMR
ncbi:MAG TPA: M28 family metallopeptidase [Solirubrobacteraceae bacterium]|nr:M28 family metallopeptidase [Solirubrobacteraceae bacterium]